MRIDWKIVIQIMIVLVMILVLSRVMFGQESTEYYEIPEYTDVFKGPGLGNFTQLCDGLVLGRDVSCTTREFLERRQYHPSYPVEVHPTFTPQWKENRQKEGMDGLGFIEKDWGSKR